MRHCTTADAGRYSGFLQLLTDRWCRNERFPPKYRINKKSINSTVLNIIVLCVEADEVDLR